MAFSRITVPLDGSAFAESVLPIVSELASKLGAAVRLISVINPLDAELLVNYGIVGSTTSPPVETRRITRRRPRSSLDPSMRKANTYLERIAGRLRRRGIEVAISILPGEAGEEIVKSAGEEEGGLTAIATHGWTGIGHDGIGSVTEAVLGASPAPVLVVRPRQGDRSSISPYGVRSVVLALDGSRHAESAIPMAVRLAGRLGVELVFFKSSGASLRYSSRDALEKAERGDATYLQRFVGREAHTGVSVRAEVTSGAPAADIVQYGDGHPGTLFVLTSQIRRGRARWVLGSVTDSVIRTGSCPVLVIPAAHQGGAATPG